MPRRLLVLGVTLAALMGAEARAEEGPAAPPEEEAVRAEPGPAATPPEHPYVLSVMPARTLGLRPMVALRLPLGPRRSAQVYASVGRRLGAELVVEVGVDLFMALFGVTGLETIDAVYNAELGGQVRQLLGPGSTPERNLHVALDLRGGLDHWRLTATDDLFIAYGALTPYLGATTTFDRLVLELQVGPRLALASHELLAPVWPSARLSLGWAF